MFQYAIPLKTSTLYAPYAFQDFYLSFYHLFHLTQRTCLRNCVVTRIIPHLWHKRHRSQHCAHCLHGRARPRRLLWREAYLTISKQITTRQLFLFWHWHQLLLNSYSFPPHQTPLYCSSQRFLLTLPLLARAILSCCTCPHYSHVPHWRSISHDHQTLP